MKKIEVKKIIKALNASDGAGVKLKRSIGTPEADYIDPFLMLDEFGSENKDDYVAGFPPHPHRGIETVTYMLNGEFEHQDSTGAKGIMASGDVQWMKTGRGIIHSEMPAMKEGKLLGFQLWINMPAKLKKRNVETAEGKVEKMTGGLDDITVKINDCFLHVPQLFVMSCNHPSIFTSISKNLQVSAWRTTLRVPRVLSECDSGWGTTFKVPRVLSEFESCTSSAPKCDLIYTVNSILVLLVS